MSKFSDHKKPQTSIFDLLPEVFRSDVNKSVSGIALDRHLTKDDTSRVTGFIGESNASALVDRRIKEETPHRQAFQLAPTMVSTQGTVTSALSQTAFLRQLELMGVDPNRLPEWGNTLQFNWVPPINIDMLVNYQDYFWRPQDPSSLPQYLTIENACNKAQSKVDSYSNMLLQRGSLFAVKRIDHATSSLVVDLKYDDLFVPGFILYTKDSTNINMQDKFWTVVTSSFDAIAGETSIQIVGTSSGLPLVDIGTVDPAAGDFVGDWFYNTPTLTLKEWSGSAWTPISTAISLNISLEERLQVFHAQANCACNLDLGWDIAQWDDNPLLWNQTLLASITSPTPPVGPVAGDLWYDTTTDSLKQFSAVAVWDVVATAFSAITAQTTGTATWDQNSSCAQQLYNQWSLQNQWVHKSEITSTSGAVRAKLPILEYDSTAELNEWVRATYNWKYRSDAGQTFQASTSVPSRLELEPIKGYYVEYVGGKWVMYLFNVNSTMCRDTDYSSTFVPGYKFRIVNDLLVSEVYTVDTVEYREITTAYINTRPNPATLLANVGVDLMCTIITLTESAFSSPQIAYGQPTDPYNTRIEPITTSTGDGWKGYHVHWVLDDESIVFNPVAHQRWNYYRQISFDTAAPQAPDTSFSAKVVGVMHLEYTVGAANVTVVDLPATLQYSATTPQMFAVPNSNEIRVYVNDVRQYGNYKENVSLTPGVPNYTLVGTTPLTSQPINYVTGVTFNQPLSLFDIVRIEVGPAPFNCMGNNAIPVRTIEDETEFALAVAAGTQPVYRSMTQCYQVEQSKTTLNQYPLFNVYDVATSQVVAANSVFSFKEDPEAAVNTYIQRRIAISVDGKDFIFEQHLRDTATEEMYAYKTFRSTAAYWYSPTQQAAYNWNGYAWTDRVVVTTATGPAVRRIIVSATQPTTTLDQSLWLNTTDSKLYQYLSGSWNNEITDLVVNETDPLLRTIWRQGLNSENYVPSYVDSTLNVVPVGSSLGDWEVVDQWMYNSEHKNNLDISYSQLVTHLRSIINSQPKIPGLQTGGIYTLLQSEFNYGLGGTIKDHNDSFDTLISAVNVNNVTPVGIIEYAEQEYAANLVHIRDLFSKSAVAYMSNYGKDTIIHFESNISDQIIAAYENNDYAAQIYGDTVAYNAATGQGVKNWIATVPMLGLGPKYQPHVSDDNGIVYVLHHDGRRSIISYTVGEQDRLARELCSTPDSRVTNGTLGIVSSNAHPDTASSFIAAFGGSTIRTGVYWYKTSGTRTLYRLQAYDVTFTAPSFYDVNGNEIPDGTMYYDKGVEFVMVKTTVLVGSILTPTWIQHPESTSAGDISPLWVEVNFATVLGEIIFNIEQRLYDVTPSLAPVFDFTTLGKKQDLVIGSPTYGQWLPDATEQAVYDNYRTQRFYAYVSANSITTPLVNAEYNAADAFTWNYVSSTFSDPHGVVQVSAVGSWQALYTQVYGTPYPHLEPWKLQGYADKPTWWDEEYLETNGTRRWKYNHATTTGMWENIRTGTIPAGRTPPAGVVPTYTYFSVNISDAAIGTYAPDALFPPFFTQAETAPVRSLFVGTDVIINKSADYVFGDLGPVEWAWSVSSQRPYDQSVIAFLMQPARFLHYAFGPTYTDIDGLQVELLFKRVYSHEVALFHGDVYDDTKQYLVRGINQWYVNFNRYSGFDTNAEFRELWVGWNPQMTYQFGGIVDTSSFDIGNKYFDVSEQDYSILLTNNGVISDVWADAFEISLLNIPPAVVQYNNQSLWKMEIDSLAAIDRSITYYGVRQYAMTVDVNTDTCSVPVTLPWVTGDTVVVSSSKFLPAPLKPDTGYYVIRASNNSFMFAETPQDALASVAIDLTSLGEGTLTVSQVESSFNVFGGLGNTAELWFHYTVDRNDIRTFTPPMTVTGMQNMINLLDGYAAFQADQGVVNRGTEANDFDPLTGRLVDWSLETERFIDWAFGLRQSRVRVNDRYEISANTTTSEFTFTSMTPYWLSGTPVVLTTTGAMPIPLIADAVYYIVSTGTVGVFKLSLSANPLDTSMHVVLNTQGSGQLYISLNDIQRSYPRFEVNPYRNNIWIDTPLGVMSNIIEGPYADIRVQQTIFDQYSRPLTPDQLTVYREDLRSHIAIRPELANDVDQIYQNDPYNYIHVGGGHFFIEGYEHFLIFNDYTTSGALIYDQFLGLWSKRFNLDYYEKTDYTLRPTLGGYYLIDGKFERNMEGATSDMRVYYDVMGLSETSAVAPRARDILGFRGRSSFLDLININQKSQFMFYRGMIQSKGSINSVKAYINSRRFVDAKLDEFWAWKIADFGDSSRRVYPEVNMFAADNVVDDVRLEFLAQSELESDPDVVDAINKGFKIVSYSTPERWNNFPEQKQEIGSPLFLDAEASTLSIIYANDNAPLDVYGHVDYWYNTNTKVLMTNVGGSWIPDTTGKLVRQQVMDDAVATDTLYFKHGDMCDDVRIIRKTVNAVPVGVDYTPYDYTTEILELGTGPNAFLKVNSEIVRFEESSITTNDVNRPVMLWVFTINPAKSKISPSKLVDKKIGAAVQQIPLWHPARGHHSHIAIHNVDLQTSVDPARYNTTLNPTIAVDNNWEQNFWNYQEVGTVWLDTNHLNYLPYYDDKIMPNVNDRLYNWGQLAPWGDIKVYEWVQSTTPPDAWTGGGTPRSQTFSRTRAPAVIAAFDYVTGTVTAAGLATDNKVIFVVDNTGTLPSGIDPAVVYVLRGTGPSFTIEDPQTELPVTFTDNGTHVYVIKTFAVDDWTEHTLTSDRIDVPSLLNLVGTPPFDYTATNSVTTIVWVPAVINNWYVNGSLPATTVDVYVNGILVASGLTVTDNTPTPTFSVTLPSAINLNEHDIIDIVRPIHVLTTDEINFDPDLQDDGTQLTQWKIDRYYSAVTKLTNENDPHSTASATYYYFWVEQAPLRIANDNRMSTSAIATQLKTIPTPHMVVQRPKDAPVLIDHYGYGVPPYDTAFSLGELPEANYFIPVLYREAIIRGISDYITDDDRYFVRFTCDHSLRNVVKSTVPMTKNKHQEWTLFRKEQMSTIPRELWDRLTEALVGYKLTDPSVRVPALERELYDATYGTDTQYGLGVDQSFVDSAMGIATIMAYLTDPTHDFKPVDINAFFAVYTFNTPADIITTMDMIYTSFSSEHVNAIWFEVLNDSLSLRAKYKELMKTSWVALHGIRVLEVGGMFDD